jgi:hypothetical protein
MGREIKFRAWHKADEKMHEVYGFSNHQWFLKGKRFPMPPGAIEILQYSGLKDCEYKDVFEGDICELRTGYGLYGALGIVGFELGEFFFTNLGEGLYGEFKIIGNIYENPELLQNI